MLVWMHIWINSIITDTILWYILYYSSKTEINYVQTVVAAGKRVKYIINDMWNTVRDSVLTQKSEGRNGFPSLQWRPVHYGRRKGCERGVWDRPQCWWLLGCSVMCKCPQMSSTIFSAVLTIHCRLLQSKAERFLYQGMIQLHRKLSIIPL